jgi:hypothetical protein
MAKAPASDAIMTPDKMKPLLALSKREPVSAAIGLTTDGEGLILLHKKAKPKKEKAVDLAYTDSVLFSLPITTMSPSSTTTVDSIARLLVMIPETLVRSCTLDTS